MTTVRLAWGGPPKAIEKGWSDAEQVPAILVSYAYLQPFKLHRAEYHFRDWVMDSGAFSAMNSGTVIDLGKYTDVCAEMLAEDEQLTEVFALDVIGDPDASLANTEAMWDAGVPAIPTYHYGSPVEHLMHLAETYPKIALGGMVLKPKKQQWCEQCFARIWPKKIHGFGVNGDRLVLALPWHSVDATNWEMGPCAFGRWREYGALSVKGGEQNLRGQVLSYLQLEERARRRWAKQMAELDTEGPTVRLAVAGGTVARIKSMGPT